MGSEIGTNRLSIQFCIRKFNLFFFKNVGLVPRKPPNLKIRVKMFLKCPLWPIAVKLGSVGTIFSQEIEQESCGYNRMCQILILTPWRLLPKIVQTVEKVMVFFPERGEEIEPWFWHIWIAQWLKFFLTNAYFFWFWSSSGGNQKSKLDQKCKLWVRPFFIKTQIFHLAKNSGRKLKGVGGRGIKALWKWAIATLFCHYFWHL